MRKVSYKVATRLSCCRPSRSYPISRLLPRRVFSLCARGKSSTVAVIAATPTRFLAKTVPQLSVNDGSPNGDAISDDYLRPAMRRPTIVITLIVLLLKAVAVQSQTVDGYNFAESSGGDTVAITFPSSGVSADDTGVICACNFSTGSWESISSSNGNTWTQVSGTGVNQSAGIPAAGTVTPGL